ncbi:hypothetical protein H0H93_004397, partial [Arthromyces matolae]
MNLVLLQKAFTELTAALPKTVERWKSDLVELSVEVIVLGRLLATEQEKMDRLDEEEFGKTMWSLVSFLEMMTMPPSVPATGKGKEPDSELKAIMVPYLDLSLPFFEKEVSRAFQKRERNYHQEHELDDE